MKLKINSWWLFKWDVLYTWVEAFDWKVFLLFIYPVLSYFTQCKTTLLFPNSVKRNILLLMENIHLIKFHSSEHRHILLWTIILTTLYAQVNSRKILFNYFSWRKQCRACFFHPNLDLLISVCTSGDLRLDDSQLLSIKLGGGSRTLFRSHCFELLVTFGLGFKARVTILLIWASGFWQPNTDQSLLDLNISFSYDNYLPVWSNSHDWFLVFIHSLAPTD